MLDSLISSVKPLDKKAMDKAKERQAQLAKPPGSLGVLEDISIQLAGITGKVHNSIKDKHLLVFASDNGVTEEGVSSAPRSVTLKQAVNLTRAKTGAAVLAKRFGCAITVCDVGIASDISGTDIVDRKIAYGTNNIAKGPAMTREDALKAVLIGASLAKETKADILGIGEMGIGNTTTASAVLSVIADCDAGAVTGRGGGITNEAFDKKKAVIKKSIEINKPDKSDVIDVLSKVGGFDIASMCGAFIGGASSGRAVVIDGFISAVAALCAVKLCPEVAGYLIPSHDSMEKGYRIAMDMLGIKPMLNLGMRLGEGSGCPLTFNLVEGACAIINDMATFDEANIDDDYLEEIRQSENIWEN